MAGEISSANFFELIFSNKTNAPWGLTGPPFEVTTLRLPLHLYQTEHQFLDISFSSWLHRQPM